MATMRHACVFWTLVCLFHLTTAAKYNTWGDIPDCAVYCIKYWTITAQGSSCHAEDPKCYCMTSAWYFSMKNCLYDDATSGCKTSQATKNKDGILSYVDNIFCPTLNGTSSTSTTSSSTTSSGARLAAAASSESDESNNTSAFTVKVTMHSSSSSTSSSSSSSDTSSSSSASSSTSSSSATSSSSPDGRSTTSTSTSTTLTTSSSSSSNSSSTVSSSAAPSSTSTSSYSVTTTVILVDPSGNIITSAPTPATTSTSTEGFVQDTSTLQSTATSSDAAAPGANLLFYDGAMEGVLAVSSMMALVMLVGGMVLLVN